MLRTTQLFPEKTPITPGAAYVYTLERIIVFTIQKCGERNGRELWLVRHPTKTGYEVFKVSELTLLRVIEGNWLKEHLVRRFGRAKVRQLGI